MCLVSQLWSQRFKPGIRPIRINLSVSTLILLACASPSSVPLSWTILLLLHHHLRIEAGACLRTCNPHISTFGTCVTTSLWCGNIFLNISLSLSIYLFVSISQTTHTSIFDNKNNPIVNLNYGRFFASTSHPIHPPWSKTPVVPFDRPAGAVFRDIDLVNPTWRTVRKDGRNFEC